MTWCRQRDRKPVYRTPKPVTLGHPDLDATVVHSDGDVFGRHGHAGHRRAALCPTCWGVGVRSDLVRHPFYTYDAARLYDTALLP